MSTRSPPIALCSVQHGLSKRSVSMHHALIGCLLSIVITSSGCSSGGGDSSAESCRVFSLAADVWPGAGDGYAFPGSIVAIGDSLYFQANDGVHGEELWAYHSATGAERLVDIVPGSGGSAPDSLTALDGRLYFSAHDGVLGRELWAFDPAEPAAGAERVADIHSGSGSGSPGKLIALNGKLYFEADDGVHGRELWSYDRDVGAAMVADLRPGDNDSSIEDFTSVGRMLYFTAYTDRNRELHFLDSADGGVTRVDIHVDPVRSSSPHQLTLLDGKLYFSADDGVHGRELWAHDLMAGAVLVADIYPGSESSYADGLTVMDGRLYMAAMGGSDSSVEDWDVYHLYSYDPVNGTMLAAGTSPGARFNIRSSHSFNELDGTLYFLAYDEIHGEELWRYDPTQGAALVVDTVPGLGGTGDDDPEPPSRLRVFDGRLYFTAFDNASEYSRAQWVYDPVTGPRILTGSWPGSELNEIPWRTTELDGRLYFSANNDLHGRELWVYDPGCAR